MADSATYIVSSCRNHVRTIRFNRTERKNAISAKMYQKVAKILNEDISNDDISVTIITGTGEYFSSGNDLKSVMENRREDINPLEIFKNMVDEFINYPKLLIAVVNGPAIGIGATLPALCDIVYASDTAIFDTPFVKLGLCLEGASSFTLPFILGRSRTSEMIFLNRKLSAKEAYHFGLVSNIIPHTQLEQFIDNLHSHGNIPINTLKVNKKLLMGYFKNILSECNVRESRQLQECVSSPEFLEQLGNFMQRRSKL